jgi:hypothetical protein
LQFDGVRAAPWKMNRKQEEEEEEEVLSFEYIRRVRRICNRSVTIIGKRKPSRRAKNIGS